MAYLLTSQTLPTEISIEKAVFLIRPFVGDLRYRDDDRHTSEE